MHIRSTVFLSSSERAIIEEGIRPWRLLETFGEVVGSDHPTLRMAEDTAALVGHNTEWGLDKLEDALLALEDLQNALEGLLGASADPEWAQEAKGKGETLLFTDPEKAVQQMKVIRERQLQAAQRAFKLLWVIRHRLQTIQHLTGNIWTDGE